jgi:hypothetical protein
MWGRVEGGEYRFAGPGFHGYKKYPKDIQIEISDTIHIVSRRKFMNNPALH